MNFRENFARFTAAAVVAAGTVTGISDALAFRMIQNTSTGRVTAGALVPCNHAGGFVHWTDSTPINWYHNTAGQGSNKASALQSALNSWTNVQYAPHTPTYAGTTTSGWATDGLNTVLWAVGNGCGPGCLALTALVLQQPGQVIIESDVTFNANYVWNTNGSQYDTQAIAAHEFGHSLGIHHTELTSTPRPTMYSSYFGTDGRSLDSDDVAALQCAQNRYPPPGSPGAPSSLHAESKLCNGSYRVKWNASSGTVNAYELYFSSNSSFTPQGLYWSGTTTYKTVTVGPSGYVRYYRVRACNSNGCGSYSNSLKLNGFSGCL